VLLHAGSPAAALRVRLGMTAPSETDDGWWLGVLFAHDADGILGVSDVAPLAGPPPGMPLQVMGPVFAGALSGLLLEEAGRQQIRLALPPAADESRPWDRPLLLRLAVRWEPMRAATMSRNELAHEVLVAFRRSVEAAGRPG